MVDVVDRDELDLLSSELSFRIAQLEEKIDYVLQHLVEPSYEYLLMVPGNYYAPARKFARFSSSELAEEYITASLLKSDRGFRAGSVLKGMSTTHLMIRKVFEHLNPDLPLDPVFVRK